MNKNVMKIVESVRIALIPLLYETQILCVILAYTTPFNNHAGVKYLFLIEFSDTEIWGAHGRACICPLASIAIRWTIRFVYPKKSKINLYARVAR